MTWVGTPAGTFSGWLPTVPAQTGPPGAGMVALVGLIILGMLIIGILIAVWVYKDAKRRDMSAGPWVLLVIFTGLIGLIIYLVVRRDNPVRTVTGTGQGATGGRVDLPPSGGQDVGGQGGGRNLCGSCGSAVSPTAKHCTQCGAALP